MNLQRIFDAAKSLQSDSSLIPVLVASTGLSREGVEYALRHQLETDPPEAERTRFLDRCKDASSVHVVLSSTVFTAALRAIAWASAKSPKVTVSPSRRSPHFAEALVRTIDDPSIALAPELELSELRSGIVHFYGADETIEVARSRLRPSVALEAHGTGLGIAIVTGDFADAAEHIAQDVVPFDQRGCLSPRIVFVAGDAQEMADHLAAALTRWGQAIPVGQLSERADIEAHVRSLQFAGHVQITRGGTVSTSDGVIVPPTGRNLHVVRIRKPDEVVTRLGTLARFVTAVGTDARVDAFPDCVPLGTMQNPPFTGPVDRRVLAAR